MIVRVKLSDVRNISRLDPSNATQMETITSRVLAKGGVGWGYDIEENTLYVDFEFDITKFTNLGKVESLEILE